MHVPGWHETTRVLQEAGRFQMVGIIQEQHPDRARLFMQWQEMGWPILVDSLDLLEVTVVPMTLAIDEHGIIRAINPDAGSIEETFLRTSYPAPAHMPIAEVVPAGGEAPGANASSAPWREYADSLYRWQSPDGLDDAIAAYNHALSLTSEDGPSHFRLGVAYRARYDSDGRQAGDFERAVSHWERALDIDPNHYIRRRRIQQYGPRLDKPYPFYDWVSEARAAIEARGESPVPLPVEPGGAEFARPAATFAAAEARVEPDAGGRIYRDPGEFVEIERLTVPTRVTAGASTRAHVVFRPNLARKAHWNNEVDDLVFWVAPPPGWEVDEQYLTVARPPAIVSQETRQVEFELRSPASATPGAVTVPGYALYYVCEDVDGTCLYRRQDVSLEIQIR